MMTLTEDEEIAFQEWFEKHTDFGTKTEIVADMTLKQLWSQGYIIGKRDGIQRALDVIRKHSELKAELK